MILLFVAPPVFAAEIYFEAPNQLGIESKFETTLFLNTEKEEINAIEGRITFPRNLLDLKEIRDANSIVNFWVEKPKTDPIGKIAFSGIIPGGYHGSRGLLLTLIFISKQEGVGTIELQEAKTLLNDGRGTSASLRVSDSKFSISKQIPTSQTSISEVKDKRPPESFVPEITQSPDLFDGKWFVVFAAQDKGSGIDYYEVKESRQRIVSIFSRWILAESPHVLQDQGLRSYVSVRAVDKAGNAQVQKIPPRNPLAWYENYENWIILILGFAIIYAMKKLLWREYLKK